MQNTVSFRSLEERDIEFIYKYKNDPHVNHLTVGHSGSFTMEDAAKWVKFCSAKSDKYKTWAVCTNDDNQRIIGWVSLGDIDYVNKCACFHGIVIADPDFKDGFAWIESYLFLFHYTFEVLNLNRLYGKCLCDHKISIAAEYVFCLKREGVSREAVYKNGKFYDVFHSAILRKEYFYHKHKGDFEIYKILNRIVQIRKKC